MKKLLTGELPMLTGLIVAVVAALGADEAWQAVAKAAVPLVAALFVRQVVSTPATVAKAVGDAATKTAAQLTTATVGAAGEVTSAATNVVGGVVNEVLGTIGGLVPSLTQKGTSP